MQPPHLGSTPQRSLPRPNASRQSTPTTRQRRFKLPPTHSAVTTRTSSTTTTTEERSGHFHRPLRYATPPSSPLTTTTTTTTTTAPPVLPALRHDGQELPHPSSAPTTSVEPQRPHYVKTLESEQTTGVRPADRQEAAEQRIDPFSSDRPHYYSPGSWNEPNVNAAAPEQPEEPTKPPTETVAKQEKAPVGETQAMEGTAVTETTTELPKGWQKLKDPSSGKNYFYNAETGETSWNAPTASPATEQPAQAIQDETEYEDAKSEQVEEIDAAKKEEFDLLPPGWTRLIDRSSDNPYYFNEQTGKTSWDAPATAEPTKDSSADDAVSGASLVEPADASEIIDEAKKQGMRDDLDQGAMKEPENTSNLGSSALPHGWQKVVDPSLGGTYYYNEITGQSTWGAPAATVEPGSRAAEPEPAGAPLNVVGSAELSEAQFHESTKETAILVPTNEMEESESSDKVGPAVSGGEGSTLLPPGWQQVVDRTSGDTYFYNEETGESSWEVPVMEDSATREGNEATGRETAATESSTADVKEVPPMEQESSETTSKEQGVEEAAALPPGWNKIVDPSSGNLYYCNEETGESSWEAPPLSANADGDAVPEEPESVEPTANAPVHEKPPAEAEVTTIGAGESVEAPGRSSDAVVGEGEPLLPSGWQKHMDPVSGDVYYYNEETGESSWEAPPLSAKPDGNAVLEEPESVEPTANEPVPEKRPTEAEVTSIGAGESVEAPGRGSSQDAVAGEGEPLLPSGWQKLMDSTSGDVYYYNEETGESSWEAPPLSEPADYFPEEPESTEPVHSETRAEEELARVNGGESAEASGMATEDEVAGEESPLPPGWQKVADPTFGDVYYYNEETGESSWEVPQLSALVAGDSVPEHLETVEPTADASLDENQPAEEELEHVDIGGSAKALGGSSQDVVMSERESPLPLGWQKLVDPTTGDVYYNNKETGESSWEAPPLSAQVASDSVQDSAEPTADATLPDSEPTEAEVEGVDTRGTDEVPLSSPPDKVMDEGESSLPSGWKKFTDPISSDVYYYNEVTGESSWETPSLSAPIAGDSVPEEPESAATNNALEPETQSPPEEEEKIDEPPGVPSGSSRDLVADEGESPLPLGWQKLVDHASGDVYYCNEETGESSWEAPPLSAPVTSESVPEEEPGLAEPTTAVPLPENQPPEEEREGVDADEASAEAEAPGVSSQAASLSEGESPLIAPGWQKVMDPTSGDFYYYNEETGRSSWEAPLLSVPVVGGSGLGEPEPAVPIADSSLPDAEVDSGKYAEAPPNSSGDMVIVGGESPLPPGWQKLMNSASDDVYYYNDETGESSWERPPLSAPPASDSIPKGAVSAEPTSGPAEKELEGVVFGDSAGAPSDSSGSMVMVEGESPLPPGWQKLVELSSGNSYYYNEETGESSWEVPPQPVLAPSDSVPGGPESLAPAVVTPVSENKAALEQLKGVDAGDSAGAPSDSAGAPSDSSGSMVMVEGESPLPPGWQKLMDPSSGDTYYYNEETGESSWEAPPPSLAEREQKQRKLVGSRTSRPAHAIATFSFRGRICVVRPHVEGKAVVAIHPTCKLMPSDAVVKTEMSKKHAGFSGPLNLADDERVSAFIQRMGSRDRDLLWNLVAISGKSRGRLRSDNRDDEADGPESAIVDLLLGDEQVILKGQGTETAESLPKLETEDGTGLNSVQELLLRGEREKAVEVALSGRHFAMALLIASLCSRETYYTAARRYADSVLLTGSPLHTVAMLFCGQLQAPQECAPASSFWGGDSNALCQSWRSHLAAIISNRTAGWDTIVVSLGDRLRDLGEIAPAHFCYMVCGCSLPPPVQHDAKMTLLGCDLSSMDMLLLTDVWVESFARTEAYEWAKRRGNRNAAIRSLQAFKLQYAMLLCDLGLVEEAKAYVDSIVHCIGRKYESEGDIRYPGFLSMLTSDPGSLFSRLFQFEQRLFLRKTEPSQYWEQIQADEMETDATFVTASSSPEDVPSSLEVTVPPKVVKTKKKAKSEVGGTRRMDKARPEEIATTESMLHSKQDVGRPSTGERTVKQTAKLERAAQSSRQAEGSKPTFIPAGQIPPVNLKPDQLTIEGSALSTEKPEKAEVVGELPPVTPKIEFPTSKPKSAPISAPANLQSSSTPSSSAKKRGIFGFGIKDRLTKMLNPNATRADLGDGMQAYYDEDRKVWVFPGEDPGEKAKPVGPPPKAIATFTPEPLSAPQQQPAPSTDPLAAMMAPPQRAPSLLRARSVGVSPPGRLPIGSTPKASSTTPPLAPPQFKVFQPKPTSESEERKQEDPGT